MPCIYDCIVSTRLSKRVVLFTFLYKWRWWWRAGIIIGRRRLDGSSGRKTEIHSFENLSSLAVEEPRYIGMCSARGQTSRGDGITKGCPRVLRRYFFPFQVYHEACLLGEHLQRIKDVPVYLLLRDQRAMRWDNEFGRLAERELHRYDDTMAQFPPSRIRHEGLLKITM